MTSGLHIGECYRNGDIRDTLLSMISKHMLRIRQHTEYTDLHRPLMEFLGTVAHPSSHQ